MKKILDSLFIILTIVVGTASALALAILMAMAIDWLFARGDVPIVTGFAQGEILLYVGNVLPFIATIILSTLVLWQNYKLSDANEKLQRRSEEMQEKDLIHKSFNFLHIGAAAADISMNNSANDEAGKHIVLVSSADNAAEAGGKVESANIVFNFEGKADGNVPINEIEVETFKLALCSAEAAAKIFSYEASKDKPVSFDVHKFVSDDVNSEDHMFSVVCKVGDSLQSILDCLKIGDSIEIKFSAAYVNVLNVKVCLESTLKLQVASLDYADEKTKCEFKISKEAVIFTGEISVKPDEPNDVEV